MRKLSFQICSLFFLFGLAPRMAWCKIPVILSTDVGNEIDDQWAITYMLVNPTFDVQGIISSHAPSLPDPSAHATYEVLLDVVEARLGMVTHPPLFEGSSLPLKDAKTTHPNTGVDFILNTSQNFSKDNRLTVLTIGAATDVASALLIDPSLAERINVVAMGFKNLSDAGKEYNVENDPIAWQVILNSDVPVTIGSGDVCQANLSLGFDQAKALISTHGTIGAWLWQEYQAWYFRSVKPLRVNDFSKPWVIWDIIVLAYEEGLTQQKSIPRPRLKDDLQFEQTGTRKMITWITSVDSATLWKSFLQHLDFYEETHKLQTFDEYLR